MAAAVEDAAELEEELRNPQRRWHHELRSIRQRERATTANYVLSLLHDAAYVSRAAAAAAPWPLLTNMRAGAWYAPPTLVHGTCYFKSTDGHAGTWAFSLNRLNWHVMRLAARHGGVALVDATRKGKRYPDALSKTVPIWCAVLSALAAAEDARASRSGGGGDGDGDGDGVSVPADDGACLLIDDEEAARFLHLPESISPSEAAQIRTRVGGWTRRLARATALRERAQLASLLRGRRLVPAWQCPPRALSRQAAASAAASQTSLAAAAAGERRNDPASKPADGRASPGRSAAARAGAADPIVVLCVSASAPVSEAESREQHSWTFIQGAGDDEESWCRGLTPGLFWTHAERLAELARRNAGECERALDALRAGGVAGALRPSPDAAEACVEDESAMVARTAEMALDAPAADAAHAAPGPREPRSPGLLAIGSTGVLLGAWGAEARAAALLPDGAHLLLLGSAAECAEARALLQPPSAAVGDCPEQGNQGGAQSGARERTAAAQPSQGSGPCHRAGQRALMIELGPRAGGRATCVHEPADLWVRHVLPASLEFARAALASDHAGVNDYAAASAGAGAVARELGSDDGGAQWRQRPPRESEPSAIAGQPTDSGCSCPRSSSAASDRPARAGPRLIIAHGAEVGVAPALAVAVAVLAALFEARGSDPAEDGASPRQHSACSLLDGPGQGLSPRAGGVAGAVSKQTICERVVFLQAQLAGSAASPHCQLVLPRALCKQLNRFFMSPLPPS